MTVDIFYYIPQTSLLNEFLWQTADYVPDIPRVHKFLLFWKDNIDAIIKDVYVTSASNDWKKTDIELYT